LKSAVAIGPRSSPAGKVFAGAKIPLVHWPIALELIPRRSRIRAEQEMKRAALETALVELTLQASVAPESTPRAAAMSPSPARQ
jgi:hypothetical protein